MDHIQDKTGPIETFVKKRKLDAGFLLAGIILGVFLGWNIVEIMIFLIFIWSIIGPIQSRYLACGALFFLSFTPILLTIGRKAQAEEYAIYAYYFLIMAVIRAIVEVWQTNENAPADEKRKEA